MIVYHKSHSCYFLFFICFASVFLLSSSFSLFPSAAGSDSDEFVLSDYIPGSRKLQSYYEQQETGKNCTNFRHCSDPCACVTLSNESPLKTCRLNEGIFDYAKFHYCTLKSAPYASIILMLLFLLCYFALVVSLSETYFSPAIGKLIDLLRVSNAIAGVTFLALGNGLIDVFTSFSAISHDSSAFGICILLGGAIFVTMVILGSVTVATPTPITLPRRPFLRDLLVLIVFTAAVFGVVADGLIHFWETLLLVVGYLGYLLLAIVIRWVYRRAKRRRREAIGIVEGEELFALNENAEDSYPMLDEILFITNIRSWKSNKYPETFLEEIEDMDEDEKLLFVDDEPTPSPQLTLTQKIGVYFSRYLTAIGWQEKSLAKKILFFVFLPLTFVQQATIPQANEWSKFFALINPMACPILFLFAIDHSMSVAIPISSFNLPVWALLLGVGGVVSIIVFFTSDSKEPPRYFVLYVIASIVMSCVWLYLVATEIVFVAKTLARVINISEEFIGLVLIGIGNSAVDLTKNTMVSKQGFSSMAFTACFTTPTFNLLLGVGTSFTFISAVTGTISLKLTTQMLMSFLYLGISLLVSLILIPLNGFTSYKWFAVLMFLGYALFLLLVVLVEFHIISV